MSDVNVLVVETDEGFRGNLAQRLESRGCVVASAGGAEGVGRQAAEMDADAVLVDLAEFGRGSLKIIEDVARHQPQARVILLSRIKDVALSIEAMKLGAFDEITMPVDIDALMKKLLAARRLRHGA